MLFFATPVSLFLALSSAVTAIPDDNHQLSFDKVAFALDPQTNKTIELFQGPGSTGATFAGPHPAGSLPLTFFIQPDGTLKGFNYTTAYMDSNFALLWSKPAPSGSMQGKFTVGPSLDSINNFLAINGDSTLNWLICGNPDGTRQLFTNKHNHSTSCTAVNLVINSFDVLITYTDNPQTNKTSGLFEGPGSTSATFIGDKPVGSSNLLFRILPNGTLLDFNNKAAFIDTNFALLWSTTVPPGSTSNFTVIPASDSGIDYWLGINGSSNWLICDNPDGTQQLFANHNSKTGCIAVRVNIVI